jgi:hypothetical protein
MDLFPDEEDVRRREELTRLLFVAARAGHTVECRRLIEEGAAKVVDGVTAAAIARGNGFEGCAREIEGARPLSEGNDALGSVQVSLSGDLAALDALSRDYASREQMRRSLAREERDRALGRSMSLKRSRETRSLPALPRVTHRAGPTIGAPRRSRQLRSPQRFLPPPTRDAVVRDATDGEELPVSPRIIKDTELSDKLSDALQKQKRGQIESQMEQWLNKRQAVGTSLRFTRSELRQLRQWFEYMDADGSGQINIQELEEPMISAGAVRSRRELLAVLRVIDSDGNSELSFEELVQTLLMARRQSFLASQAADGSDDDPLVEMGRRREAECRSMDDAFGGDAEIRAEYAGLRDVMEIVRAFPDISPDQARCVLERSMTPALRQTVSDALRNASRVKVDVGTAALTELERVLGPGMQQQRGERSVDPDDLEGLTGTSAAWGFWRRRRARKDREEKRRRVAREERRRTVCRRVAAGEIDPRLPPSMRKNDGGVTVDESTAGASKTIDGGDTVDESTAGASKTIDGGDTADVHESAPRASEKNDGGATVSHSGPVRLRELGLDEEERRQALAEAAIGADGGLPLRLAHSRRKFLLASMVSARKVDGIVSDAISLLAAKAKRAGLSKLLQRLRSVRQEHEVQTERRNERLSALRDVVERAQDMERRKFTSGQFRWARASLRAQSTGGPIVQAAKTRKPFIPGGGIGGRVPLSRRAQSDAALGSWLPPTDRRAASSDAPESNAFDALNSDMALLKELSRGNEGGRTDARASLASFVMSVEVGAVGEMVRDLGPASRTTVKELVDRARATVERRPGQSLRPPLSAPIARARPTGESLFAPPPKTSTSPPSGSLPQQTSIPTSPLSGALPHIQIDLRRTGHVEWTRSGAPTSLQAVGASIALNQDRHSSRPLLEQLRVDSRLLSRRPDAPLLESLSSSSLKSTVPRERRHGDSTMAVGISRKMRDQVVSLNNNDKLSPSRGGMHFDVLSSTEQTARAMAARAVALSESVDPTLVT